MDIVLEITDHFFFDKAYAQLLPKDGRIAGRLKEKFLNQLLANVTNFSSTGLLPTPLRTVAQLALRFQRKNEIYGEVAPRFLPVTQYASRSLLGRSNLLREFLSVLLITTVFGWILYFAVASFAYVTVFDKKIFNHPRYLKNQLRLEIRRATLAIPIMVALTTPFFLLELHGFSRLYLDVNESTGGWKLILLQFPLFIFFTDFLIYCIHRFLHWPSVYKALHKPHHKWIVCTPFASHAFHPIDGWFQSLPYHLFPLFFPLNKVSYLVLFIFVNFWTVMIHDGSYWSNDPIMNGTACHTVHHLYFNYNYGQFTTLWDRLGGSYRRPDDSFFTMATKGDDEKIWKDQTVKMEIIRGELEGDTDDRVYIEEKSGKVQK